MNREEAHLTAALRAVPGVADAELAEDSAEGVRVRLSPDADPTDVAAAVRDVLAHHGLRGRMAPPQARIEPQGPPPPPPDTARIMPGPRLVQTTLVSEDAAAEEEPLAIAPEVPEPAPVEPPSPEPAAGPEAASSTPPEPEPPPSEPEHRSAPPEPAVSLEAFIRRAPAVEGPAPDPAGLSEAAGATGAPIGEPTPPAPRRALLSRVRVQEDRDGVAVTIDTDDGRTVTRRGRPSDAGVREAVVAAVGELSGDQPPPVLVAVEEHTLGERRLVTVLLQRHDGTYHVGSALIGAEKAFALARAAWAAMSQIG